MKHTPEHPGFKVVEEKIGKNPKITDPGAVLGAVNKAAREKQAHGGHVANKRLLRLGGRQKGH